VTFVPCYSRCVQYQISCLGKSGDDAAVACSASASSSPPMNTASDANCFCGDNFVFGASPHDVCSGNCNPISECGSCPTIPRMDNCLALVGAALSTPNRNLTTQGQAYQLDAFIASSYSQATSANGWSFDGQTIKIRANSSACSMAFSSYFCMHPKAMQAFELSGSCGVAPPAAFIPCLQRCVAYQISCLGAESVSAATSACTSPSNDANAGHTPSNSDCFCGNNFPYGGGSFDSCAGPCSPTSECGACPTVTSMATCGVLVGTALSSSSATSYVQAKALEVDAYIASAYQSAMSEAGWTYDTRNFQVTDSPACRTAFASYFCLSPRILAAHALNGSCGVAPPAAFAPCLRRCTAFQISCLGRFGTSSAGPCATLAAARMNAAGNANCVCSDSDPTRPAAAARRVCHANCSADSQCAGAPPSRPPGAAPGLAAALVLPAVLALARR
jgi:hypothetical protein